jgi:peroxiredoxin
MRHWMLLLLVAIAGAASALTMSGSAGAAATVYKVGDEVADATLCMADGSETKLSACEGTVVVLFFYGTSWRHAPEDAARVEALRKAREKQKLAVVGVARDAKAADAKKFAEDNKLGFPQAVDVKSELYAKFASKGMPYVVVLDAKRKLKHSAAGIDDDALDAVLTDLLGAKEPAPKKDGGGGKK